MGNIFAGRLGLGRKRCFPGVLIIILGFLIGLTRMGLAAEQTLPSTRIASNTVPIEIPAKPIPIEIRKFISSCRVKTGFRVEVVASEPLVSAPIAMAFDEDGRLFVCENPAGLAPAGAAEASGRIRLMEDADGDGIYDSANIFADGLTSPSALACYDHGLFVASGHDILYLKNDGSRKVVFSGFNPVTNSLLPKTFLNNFNWGLDNRIYGAAAGQAAGFFTAGGKSTQAGSGPREDFSFDPRSLTLVAESGSAGSGLTFENDGARIISDFVRPACQSMYSPHHRLRNVFFPAPDPVVDMTAPATRIFRYNAPEVRPGLRARRGTAVTNLLVRDWFSQARGLVAYRGSAFPTNYLNSLFIPDTAGHLIHHAIIRRNGVELSAEPSPDEQNLEFLVSQDARFNPVQIVNGPDGNLYVADFSAGGGSGRILRISAANFKVSKARPQLAKASTRDLVGVLASPNGWHRDTAARLIYERRDPAAVALLASVIQNSQTPLARLHAFHALDGLIALNETLLLRGLRDSNEQVRENAVGLCEKLVKNGLISDPLWGQLRLLAGDSSAAVRYQLALTLGEIQRSDRAAVLAGILQQDPEDRWIRYAVLSSLPDQGAALLTALAGLPAWNGTAEGLRFLQDLATMVGVQGKADQVNRVIDYVVDAGLPYRVNFYLLYGLGEGLRRTGSSLGLVAPGKRLQPFYDQCLSACLDDTLAQMDRITAIRFRSVTPYVSGSYDDLIQLLVGSGEPQSIQSATIASFGRYDNPAIFNSLFNQWANLSIASRAEAISAMLTRGVHLPKVVAALESGQLQAGEFTTPQLNFLRTFHDPAISQRALKVLGPMQSVRPGVEDQFRPATTMGGDLGRGRELFMARCNSCHGPGSQAPGPDLTTLRPLGKDYILNGILQPNAQLAPEYATYVLDTKESDIFVGVLHDENQLTVTLRKSDGTAVVLPRSNLEVIQRQSWSLMPDGLEHGMTTQSMADLLEYIMNGPWTQH
jgi:putative membrane-bound dehydrogenase-like protein